MTIDAFVERWRVAEQAERTNAPSFLNELCDVLEVERPPPARFGTGPYRFRAQRHASRGGRARRHAADRPVLPRLLHPGNETGRQRAALAPGKPADLSRRFQRAQPAKVSEMLETLAVLGQARVAEDGRYHV